MFSHLQTPENVIEFPEKLKLRVNTTSTSDKYLFDISILQYHVYLLDCTALFIVYTNFGERKSQLISTLLFIRERGCDKNLPKEGLKCRKIPLTQ